MIRWHIIFHERLYSDHYDTLSKEDVQTYLRFVGVNELYEKTIPVDIPRSCIVYEKDFPGYDPLLQMCRYYESSVMFHLYRRPELLEGVDFVGFGQYDMILPKAAMDQIKSIPLSRKEQVLVYQSESDPRLLFSNPLGEHEWSNIINHFNCFHNTSFTLYDVMKHPLLLYHSYGVSVSQFQKVMKWIESVQPLMLRFLKFDKRHLCGTIERLYGIYFSLHRSMGTFKEIIVLRGMDHLNDKKFQDPVKSFCVDMGEQEVKEKVKTKAITIANPVTKGLSILLVGHGSLPIPPNGWGAVESLIYEYKCQLETLGHTVSLLNTPDMRLIVEHLHTHSYDVVHFHNDALINLMDHIPKTVNVAITSHYPYIHDPSKWKDPVTGYNYEQIVLGPLLHHIRNGRRIHVCVLSQKDYAAFSSYGVPATRMSLCLNGFNSDRFQIETEDPKHAFKTLCLAQIIKRKRQTLLYGIPEIMCVGKINEPLMTPPADQYLGEWTDTEKYATMTHFGNSILVSDGENGTPLSVKESLCAGLGIVVTSAAASELPKDWCWVTILDESKLHDQHYLRQTCETNRNVTALFRSTIREKAKELWDWSILVPKYVKAVKEAFHLA